MSNKVTRAIIMAAGKGTRMAPLTDTVPKPLIEVNGIRMIDTVINALHTNGINEIYVVVGYLKEQFYRLTDEYEGIHIIENPYFNEWNNLSSLYVARDFAENAIILDGDLVIRNAKILNPEFEKSGYNAIWTDTKTDEWLMQEEGGKVVSCSRTGGEKGWQLFSISRWSQADGKRLRELVEIEFEQNRNKDIYWDDVPMFLHFDDFDLGIRPMNNEDVIEIDSFKELCEVDSSYRQ